MKQEDKELLLKDLCARLPYKPIVINENLNGGYPRKLHFGDLSVGKYIDSLYVEGTKIYLRPLSSMTDEERDEFRTLGGVMSHNVQNDTWAICAFTPEAYDWLNAHHFDYRGLIEKGLALEAPEGMYK